MTGTEWKFILGISFVFSFVGFLALYGELPVGANIFSTFDFAYLSGGTIGVAGACVVATGIPCAVALGIFGLIGFIAYAIVSLEIIKLVIFVPLLITLTYIVSKLARGGG